MLTTRQAAELLGIAPKTLRNWRYLNLGPPYKKRGYKAVFYEESAIDRFIYEEIVDGGVSPVRSNDWAAEIIKAGYRVLSRRHHPDIGGDTETMKQVNQAAEDLRKALR